MNMVRRKIMIYDVHIRNEIKKKNNDQTKQKPNLNTIESNRKDFNIQSIKSIFTYFCPQLTDSLLSTSMKWV